MKRGLYRLILFDGVCNMCNGWVDFVIRRDKAGKFRFGALQSDQVLTLLKERGLHEAPLESIVLVSGERVYRASGAVLRILGRLPGLWPVFLVFLVVPPFIRNAVYAWIAKNRYRWFGRREACRLPTPQEKARFI